MNITDENTQALILIAGGTETDRKILRSVFEHEYYVKEAQSSAQTLEIIHSQAVLAVLCDLEMPDCFEVLERIGRENELLLFPVFAVTAENDENGQMRAFDFGVEDIITKPVKPRVVLNRVQNAVKSRLSQLDALTGLYSSDLFFRKSAGIIAREPSGAYLLACFDVDNFNAINSQYGRETGDRALKQIANVVSGFVDTYHGIACRISADNFAMLLPSDTPAVLPELIVSVEDGFKAEGIHIKLQLSIGRYLIEDKSLPFNDMMNKALLAKRSVKGRYNVSVATYNHEMQERFMEDQRILSQMEYALTDGQFEVWLQPQYNHETGALVGAEALTRWRSKDHKNLIPPDVFIPLFEKNGFIYELDKYIWKQVCKILRRWLDEGRYPLPVSVNVSRIDILKEDFYETLTGLVEAYGIPVELLQLEITESALSFDIVRIVEMVKRLRAYGFTIEIDDFGSGYSSFSVLKDVPADVLKLDMRFLSGKDNTGRGGNIIESIVRMAKWIDMRVIAEGVETKEQADFLQSIGCLLIQGYYYDRPMPVNEFENLSKCREKAKNIGTFETISALDGNAFWNSESMESLIFNSYVGGACVMEFTDGGCEIIRANEKYREEMRTDIPLTEILKIDPLTFMSQEEAWRFKEEVRIASRDGVEMRGDIIFHDHLTEPAHEECLRYYGRVIAKSPACSVVYLLIENITEQKQTQQKVAETTEQLQFLNEVSKRILSNPDTRTAIESLLARQMAYFNADSVYVMECSEKQQIGRVSYVVCSDGLSSIIDMTKRFPYEEMSGWIKQLKSDKQIVIENIEALDEERSVEKKKLLEAKIHSLIAVPLMQDGVLIGMLGACNPRRSFNFVGYLSALGDYVAVLLNRRDLLTTIENDNESMQRLMNDTPGGFVRMKMLPDGGAQSVFINDGFCRMMGMSHEEAMVLYGENAFAGVHPEDIAEIRQAVIKAMKEDGIFSARARFYHKEKGYMHFQAFYRTTTDSNGVQYTNGYYADMTAEVELEEWRKELLDNLPCGAAVYEMKNGILSVRHINKRFSELVSRDKDQIHRENAITAVHPDDRGRVMTAVREAVSGGEMACDFRVLHGNGGYLPMHVVGKTEVQDDETILIYVTYIPITEEALSESIALADRQRAEQLANAEQAAKEINEQLSFLNDASRYLLMRDEPDHSILLTLEKTMEYFDGDRAYIFEMDDEKQVSQNTYEFCAPGIPPEKDNLQNLPYAIQEYALEIFKNKGHVCLKDIESIRKSGIDKKQIITSQGIYSLILVPLWMGETLIGYMGVDNPKRNVSHADHLLALGDYIAAILLRRDNEAQILSDNRIMHELMNDMPGGFVQMKMYPDGRVEPMFINEEFCRMSGMNHEQCVEYYGHDAFTGLHPDDQEMARKALADMIENRNTSTLRLRLANGSGIYVTMQVFYRVTDDNAGNLYLNGYYTDLTDQIAVEERKMAEHDQLTGLFNRTKLAQMQNGEYQTLTSCGVIFFDVNHLKEVNDTRGHDVGDVLLRIVADSIRSIIGRRIHGYRYGGDEFLVVVCDGQEPELEKLIKLWRTRMEALAKDREVNATAAVGTAWSEAPFLLSDLIHKADKAMYADKQSNKKD